jgi:hypothetical protein
VVDTALVYLEEFAPDDQRERFEATVRACLKQNGCLMVDTA